MPFCYRTQLLHSFNLIFLFLLKCSIRFETDIIYIFTESTENERGHRFTWSELEELRACKLENGFNSGFGGQHRSFKMYISEVK